MVGIGNPSRTDDGVGQYVVDQLQNRAYAELVVETLPGTTKSACADRAPLDASQPDAGQVPSGQQGIPSAEAPSIEALATNQQAGLAKVRRAAFTSIDVDCVHQLTPELADEIKDYDVVVFVDARVGGKDAGIDLSPVEPTSSRMAVSHYWTAASLLALTRQLFGRTPQAFILSIPGRNFGFGDHLSDETRADADLALSRLADFIGGHTPWTVLQELEAFGACGRATALFRRKAESRTLARPGLQPSPK